MHDAVTQKIEGFPLVIVAPAREPVTRSVRSASSRATTTMRWRRRSLIRADPGRTGDRGKGGQNQVPSNARATLPLTAPDISMIKMVDYDFATFGQPEERSRLLSRFDNEIHPTQ